jgi:hypothetical protein
MPTSTVPPLPTKVLPGQLISVDTMNAIIDELARLRAGAGTPTGTVSVPSFFGLTLAQTRALIAQPTTQVSLGAVLDITGAGIDILATANAGRIVINQAPAAGALVAPTIPVNLVVSGDASGAPPPPPPAPTITDFQTIGGTSATGFRVSDQMVVVGTNFNVVASQNAVTVGGVVATVLSDPGDPTRRLIVTIPTGIPGAPTTSTGAPLANVQVSVTVGTAPAVLRTITVNPPPAAPGPTITSFTASVVVGGSLTITGQNFGPDVTRNRVSLSGTVAGGGTTPASGVPGTITSANTTTIVVTVPDFGDLPAPHLSSKTSQIRVEVLASAGGAVTGTAVSATPVTIVRP